MGPKVVAAFTKAHEAYFARIQLEIEGIDSFVFDEYLIGIHPLYSAAVGGVKLAVCESDAEKARVVLMKHQEEQRAYLETIMHMCPKCHSTNLRRISAFHLLITLVFVFTFGIMWLVLYRKRKCKECGHSQAW